jgi:PhoPQ-activated pathogenicity-related protein
LCKTIKKFSSIAVDTILAVVKMASDIKSVQEAIDLIAEVYRSYGIDDPQKLANWKSIANVIKGFLDKPEFFIREIIQNADDAKSKEVVMELRLVLRLFL